MGDKLVIVARGRFWRRQNLRSIVYHGSHLIVDKPDIVHSRDNLDFGRGFYVTDLKEQAESWTERFYKNNKQPILNVYDLDIEAANNDFKVKRFNEHNEEWLDYNDEVYFQLDPFHLQKAIRSSDVGGDYLKQVSTMLRENKIDDLFEYLDAVANSLETKNAEERVRRLIGYLRDNRNGLIPYLKRGLKLQKLPEGLVYKGMGNGEHNMFLVVAKRMKHRGACWSPQGGLKLCKLLCHKVSNTLAETIESLTTSAIPECLQKLTTKPLLSASKTPVKAGKGYEGKHTSMPFADYALSNRRKEIMDWLKGKDFTIPSYFEFLAVGVFGLRILSP